MVHGSAHQNRWSVSTTGNLASQVLQFLLRYWVVDGIWQMSLFGWLWAICDITAFAKHATLLCFSSLPRSGSTGRSWLLIQSLFTDWHWLAEHRILDWTPHTKSFRMQLVLTGVAIPCWLRIFEYTEVLNDRRWQLKPFESHHTWICHGYMMLNFKTHMGCCWFFLETGTTRVFRVVSCSTAKTEPQSLGPNEHHRPRPEEGTSDMKQAAQTPCKNSSAAMEVRYVLAKSICLAACQWLSALIGAAISILQRPTLVLVLFTDRWWAARWPIHLFSWELVVVFSSALPVLSLT